MNDKRDWTKPSDKPLVEYAGSDGIALLTLCDPPANTYSYAMMRQLDDAILRARFDEAVHVIVITGSGLKFFCASFDSGTTAALRRPASNQSATPTCSDLPGSCAAIVSQPSGIGPRRNLWPFEMHKNSAVA